MTAKVEVTGINQTVKALLAAGVELDDLKDVFGDIAKEGARIAASFAPTRTGKLQSSIRGNRAKNKAVVIAGKAKVPYAAAINYGWRKRGIRPSHFMQKADEALAPTLVPRLTAALGKLLADQDLT